RRSERRRTPSRDSGCRGGGCPADRPRRSAGPGNGTAVVRRGPATTRPHARRPRGPGTRATSGDCSHRRCPAGGCRTGPRSTAARAARQRDSRRRLQYRETGGATDALAEVPTSRSHGADLVSLAVLVAVEARARLAIIVIGENPTGRAHGGHDLHRGGGVSAVALRPMHPMRTATSAPP